MKKIRINWIEITVFLFWLSIYIYTSSRTLIEGDTGEFLGVAAVHGVAHAPGYPLLSLISWLVYLLPFGNPVWQVNIISSVFGACTLVLIFKIVKSITHNIPSALFSTLALGTYEYFWLYSLVIQVHVLHVFIEALVIYFSLRYFSTKIFRNIYAAVFLFGLGVSNSFTIIFLLPTILFTLWQAKRNIGKKRVILLVICACCGLLPYVYIIWAASINPPINWDRVHDFGSFLYLFFRADYGSVSLSKTDPAGPFIYSSFIYYFTTLKIIWYILPFSVLSLILLWKKNIFYLFLLVDFLLSGPFFYLLINNAIHTIVYKINYDQFLSYSYLFLFIFAGLGLHQFITIIKFKNNLLINFLILLFFIIPFTMNFQKVKLNTDTLTEITTKFELSEIGRNGILLTWYDSLYLPSEYWQYVKHYRNDVKVVSGSLLTAAWYRENVIQMRPSLRDYITHSGFDFNKACQDLAGKNQLYIYPWYPELDQAFEGKCTIIPYGLIAKVVPSSSVPSIEEIKNFNDKAWRNYTAQVNISNYKNKSTRIRETLFNVAEQLSYIGYYYSLNNKFDLALRELILARNVSPDETGSIINESAILFSKDDYKDGIDVITQGIERNPFSPLLYRNLGFIFLKTNQPSKAYNSFSTYLQFNPTNDSTLPMIDSFMSRYTINNSQ